MYNLVQHCSVAGKVTIGLESHWPCVTEVVYPSTWSVALREMCTPSTLQRSMTLFTFIRMLILVFPKIDYRFEKNRFFSIIEFGRRYLAMPPSIM